MLSECSLSSLGIESEILAMLSQPLNVWCEQDCFFSATLKVVSLHYHSKNLVSRSDNK
jgi:hypothetical protein